MRRFPIGPIAAISPFNFPLNLVAHKLAPAIAAGCPVVLKPASQTPISALKLAGIILEAGWPAAALSVLPMNSKDAAPLVEDDRFKLLTFTGSPVVGWDMKRRAGRKRVTLELGGNAGCIVHSDADLAFAAERCAVGGFSYAGQSCISVQRVFVHEPVYEEFMDSFVPKVRALKVGHPLDEATDLGSLISAGDGERVGAWLAEARAAGAECLVGGDVQGRRGVADGGGQGRAGAARERAGGIRAGGHGADLRRFRGCAAGGQRQRLRPPGRRIHPRCEADLPGLRGAGGGRR